MRIILLFFLAALLSCNKDNAKKHNYELVGKWKRVESYVNPGNGGRWEADRSNPPITIEFTADGKFISSSSLYSNFAGYTVRPDNTIEFTPSLNGLGQGFLLFIQHRHPAYADLCLHRGLWRPFCQILTSPL